MGDKPIIYYDIPDYSDIDYGSKGRVKINEYESIKSTYSGVPLEPHIIRKLVENLVKERNGEKVAYADNPVVNINGNDCHLHLEYMLNSKGNTVYFGVNNLDHMDKKYEMTKRQMADFGFGMVTDNNGIHPPRFTRQYGSYNYTDSEFKALLAGDSIVVPVIKNKTKLPLDEFGNYAPKILIGKQTVKIGMSKSLKKPAICAMSKQKETYTFCDKDGNSHTISRVFGGKVLSDAEMNDVVSGNVVEVPGVLNKKTGRTYTASVRLSDESVYTTKNPGYHLTGVKQQIRDVVDHERKKACDDFLAGAGISVEDECSQDNEMQPQ